MYDCNIAFCANQTYIIKNFIVFGMPMGNIKLEEVPQYIEAGAAAVGVGRDLYKGFNFSEITNRTKKIMQKLKG